MKKKFITILIIIFSGISTIVISIIMGKAVSEKDKQLKKVHELYNVLNRWLQIRLEGKTLINFFRKNNYKTIAIYGMKELGERLYDELSNSDIKVSYIIDKNPDRIYTDINVVVPDSKLKSVDVIVVTAIYYFDEIKEMLSQKINCPIISLEDILYEI